MARKALLTLCVMALVAGIARSASLHHTDLPHVTTSPPVTARQADIMLTQSTAQVLSVGCDLANREGSAVIVGPGQFLTNGHVVVGSRIVDVSADEQPTVVADVPAVAKAGDVATVTADVGPLHSLTLAPSDPKPGEQVRVAGFPSAPAGERPPGLVIDTGEVVGPLAGGDVGQPWPVLRLTVSAEPGMSGGPVLDPEGHLAGIVFGDEIPTGQALMIPASALRAELAGGQFVAGGCE